MTDESAIWDGVSELAENYVRTVRAELSERWSNWDIDLSENEMHEVVGALLARQVTLATQLACSPSAWNGHIAPLVLRSMTDVYINLAWILEDPVQRSRQFILFGLGQEKLDIEHRRQELKREGKSDEDDVLIKAKENWINQQRYTFLVEVNVGSWSGKPTRILAEESGCLDLFRYAYTPFSAAVHSTWNHVGRYNLTQCSNPLHKYHRIPIDRDFSPDIDYLYRAACYVEKTFQLFDEKTKNKTSLPSGLSELVRLINELGNSVESKRDGESKN